MARPNKPLNAYPSELRQLSHAAISTPAIFPLTIPFANSTEAMAFRVLFYTYRRTLRAHLAHAESSPTTPDVEPHLIIEAQGAELIQSPRINPRDAHQADSPHQTNCIFSLAASMPSTKQGVAALSLLLTNCDELPIYGIAEQPQEHPQEPWPQTVISETKLPDHIASRKTPPASKPLAITIVIDGVTFIIPIDDLDEAHRDMDPEKIALLYSKRLASPAFPLATYRIED